jgi:hypothetical protein
MSVQNPTIPTATQAKGIDSVVLDLQTHLDFELSWLTNGMGRAYRLSKVRANQTTVFLPEVYLGTSQFKYFAATPDNDKQGQSIFFVGDATLPDQQKGFYGWVQHEIGIIFSANLKTIDSALLATEDFTEHLIQDVREALIRDLVGKSYRLTIDSITRDFDDVYAEFDVSQDRGIAHAPMTHFRVNATVIFREDCAGVSLDRCAAILQNLSSDDLCNCVIPSIDFTVFGDCLSQQQLDDISALIGPGYENETSLTFNGVNSYVRVPANAPMALLRFDPFSVSAWIKIPSYHNGHIYTRFQSTCGTIFSVSSLGVLSFQMARNTSVSAGIVVRTTELLPLNQWVHVAVTYAGTSLASGVSFYIDGVLATNNVINDALGGEIDRFTPAPVVGTNVSLNNFLNGQINMLRLWNVEQNQAFITDDYNFDGVSAKPKAAEDTANLIFEPRFNDCALYSSYSPFNWRFADDSGTNRSVETVASVFADITNDIPT